VKDLIPLDHDIPIPRKQSGNERYDWTAMGIDDSFFVPGANDASLAAAGNSWAKYWDRDWKFSTRRLTENDVEGVRIWRVK